MHNKDKIISDKKLPYEYNICLYILEELCDKGVSDVFEMTEATSLSVCKKCLYQKLKHESDI